MRMIIKSASVRYYSPFLVLQLLLLIIVHIHVCFGTLNIALHAQVFPKDKVVGSVITTEGLLAAFKRRDEVSHCEIFYPFRYGSFFKRKWDLLIIEGWFPMINEFIALCRNHSPDTIIIFYCLDPFFPDLNVTSALDIDGFMTNSRKIQAILSELAPTIYLLLAADEEKMVPLPNIIRSFGAVYVGAGGGMINYKNSLVDFLKNAAPHGLRLHGSHWYV
jgi:hypothetical protein